MGALVLKRNKLLWLLENVPEFSRRYNFEAEELIPSLGITIQYVSIYIFQSLPVVTTWSAKE